MKKIGVNLINFTSPQIAGVGYFFKRLMEQIALINHDYIFIFYVSGNYNHNAVFSIPETEQYKVINVGLFKKRWQRIFFEQTRFKKFIKEIDLLYSPTAGIPLTGTKNVKVVITIHDLIPFVDKKKYGVLQRGYIKFLTKIALNNCGKVITVSNNSKNDINLLLGCDKNKISIVNNFVNNLECSNISLMDKGYFVTVSTIQPGKNLERMLEAFRLYLNKTTNYNIKFYIIGKYGWNYASVLNKVTGLELENNVVFTGYLKDEEKNTYLKNASAMVYCSLYEGFGIPPLEAMYFGVPSVVSNNSSLPEVVGQTGILVDPYDVNDIVKGMIAICNTENRNKLIGNMPRQIAKFSPQIQGKNFLSVLNEVFL